MADTMLTFTNDTLSRPLSNEEIMKTCPHAFKTDPTNPGVSNRYVQATTIDVVNDMRKLGWYPVAAKQCRPKKGSKGIRSFHMLAFQNPEVRLMTGDEIEAYPRIILTNSHDGFNSFKFMVGLYRLVCSNGLIICDEEFANISIKHINYTFETLRETVKAAIESVPSKVRIINAMKSTVLTEDEKKEFAAKAIKIRKKVSDDEKLSISRETIEEILNPKRKEDEGNDLWNVYNVVQERLMKGEFSYSEENSNKSRKQRKINSVTKDLALNTALFSLAKNYMTVSA
jgi:hypothetical protein